MIVFCLFGCRSVAAPKDSSYHIWLSDGLGIVKSPDFDIDIQFGMNFRYKRIVASVNWIGFSPILSDDPFCSAFNFLAGPSLSKGIFMLNAETGLSLLHFQDVNNQPESLLKPGLPFQISVYIMPARWLAIGLCGYFCRNRVEDLASAGMLEGFGSLRNRIRN